MLNVRRGPSTVDAEGFEERLAAIVEEPLPDSDEARRRRLRQQLTRRLLDDPVVEYEALDEEAFAYLQKQRAFLLARIEQWTGLVPEVRAEGIALVDERDELSDLKMPEQGISGHLALLLAEHLAEEARRGATVGRAALEAHVAELIARHRGIWRKDVGEVGAERRLAEEAVERFEALGLVRRTEDGVEPRPAIARYGVREVEVVGPGEGAAQASLFGSGIGVGANPADPV